MTKKLYKWYNMIWTIVGLFLVPVCHAQTQPVAISQIDSSMAKEAKPILILLSTDWCKYCQLQKSQLLRNKDFQAKANLFYYVEFDAESKENVRFHGQDYVFKTTGVSTGVNELAIVLNGPGPLSFPTWVLLGKDYEVLFRYKGVLSSKQLKELLQVMKKLRGDM